MKASHKFHYFQPVNRENGECRVCGKETANSTQENCEFDDRAINQQ